LKTNSFIENALDYLRIGFGLILTSLGLDLFLVPNKIAAGGVSGVATILHHLFNFPVGMSMLVMNFFLFLIAFYVVGKGFGIKTLITSALLSVSVDMLSWLLPWKHLTNDLLIAVIFGDLLTGTGIAIVFDRNASTGGTDIIARILNRYTQLNIGRSLLMIDFVVAASAGICLRSMDIGMYSMLAVLINCLTIDSFVDMLNISKKVLIVSSKSREIAKIAMKELYRGGTFLPFEGAFTGRKGDMLMMVIRPRQTAHLREIVKAVDPAAFMIVSNVKRVLGKGFKSLQDPSSEI
jgi:uncharacterized membrane-anchored protein YitT (DUF2179 family)